MNVQRVRAPSGGWDPTSAPDYVQEDRSHSFLNLLPGIPGKAVVRGPLLTNEPLAVAPAVHPGGWVGNAVPGSNARRILLLNTGGTATQVAPSSAEAVVALPGGVTSLRDSHAMFATGHVVGCANDFLMFWDSGIAATSSVTNGPARPGYITQHLGRMFVLQGTPPGGGTYTTNGLYWTDPDPYAGISGNALSVWQDDVTGLTNQIQLADDPDWYGMVSAKRVLYLLSGTAIYGLYGTKPSEFTVLKVADFEGAVDYTPYGDGFFYINNNGLSYFDGATTTNVSGAMASLFSHNVFAATTQCEYIGNGYVSALLNGYWLLYHIASHSWTLFTSPAILGSSGVWGFAAQSPSTVRNGRDGGTVFVVADGSAPMVADGSLLTDVSVTLGVGGYDTDPTGADHPFTVQAYSKLARLGNPTNEARVEKLYADAVLQSGDLADHWLVQLLDESFNVLAFVQVGATATQFRVRAVGEALCEIESAYVEWTLTGQNGTSKLIPRAEIHDAYLTWSPTQQR